MGIKKTTRIDFIFICSTRVPDPLLPLPRLHLSAPGSRDADRAETNRTRPRIRADNNSAPSAERSVAVVDSALRGNFSPPDPRSADRANKCRTRQQKSAPAGTDPGSETIPPPDPRSADRANPLRGRRGGGDPVLAPRPEGGFFYLLLYFYGLLCLV